ncbi:MAG: hypothetical protein KY469_16655 [Actinobacteria bacterium]|nr:hypothetical protein [Actinomycetota bacterium]
MAATVDAFLELQATNRGTELAAILTDEAVLDMNVPEWRFQVGGGQAISAAFADSFPAGFRTTGSRREATPTGAVVEYDGWDVAHDTYYRHLVWLELHGTRISRLTLYCTGGWDTQTLERQRREAPMVDTEPTGGPR